MRVGAIINFVNTRQRLNTVPFVNNFSMTNNQKYPKDVVTFGTSQNTDKKDTAIGNEDGSITYTRSKGNQTVKLTLKDDQKISEEFYVNDQLREINHYNEFGQLALKEITKDKSIKKPVNVIYSYPNNETGQFDRFTIIDPKTREIYTISKLKDGKVTSIDIYETDTTGLLLKREEYSPYEKLTKITGFSHDGSVENILEFNPKTGQHEKTKYYNMKGELIQEIKYKYSSDNGELVQMISDFYAIERSRNINNYDPILKEIISTKEYDAAGALVKSSRFNYDMTNGKLLNVTNYYEDDKTIQSIENIDQSSGEVKSVDFYTKEDKLYRVDDYDEKVKLRTSKIFDDEDFPHGLIRYYQYPSDDPLEKLNRKNNTQKNSDEDKYEEEEFSRITDVDAATMDIKAISEYDSSKLYSLKIYNDEEGWLEEKIEYDENEAPFQSTLYDKDGNVIQVLHGDEINDDDDEEEDYIY